MTLLYLIIHHWLYYKYGETRNIYVSCIDDPCVSYCFLFTTFSFLLCQNLESKYKKCCEICMITVNNVRSFSSFFFFRWKNNVWCFTYNASMYMIYCHQGMLSQYIENTLNFPFLVIVYMGREREFCLNLYHTQ